MCVLDYDTVAAVDKFGNVFVLRLPEGINDDVEVAAGARKLWDQVPLFTCFCDCLSLPSCFDRVY
jgi:hypothetical protein